MDGAVNLMYGIFSNTVAVNNLNPLLADGKLEIDDSQWGFGANLGVLYEISPSTRVGAQYTTETAIDFKDTVSFTGLGPGLTAALRANGKLDSEIAMDLTVPQTLMFSFFHQISPTLALLGNVGWQDWSEYGRIGIEVAAESITSLTLDRNYDDSYHAAFGMQ